MHDTEPMRFFENVANLGGNLNRARGAKTNLSSKCLRERLAFDELHDDEVTTVRQVPSVENHGGVLVPQLGHGSRFTQEPFGDVAVTSKFAFDDFYSDGAFQSQVGGKIDRAHASGTDFTFDSESTGNNLGDVHMRPSFGLKVAGVARKLNQEKRTPGRKFKWAVFGLGEELEHGFDGR
jgi:hypothetical protein